MSNGTGSTTPAGLLELFTAEAETAAEGVAESAILVFIEAEKKKAIADAKRELIPVVIGTGLIAGAAGALLIRAFTKK